MLFPIDCKEGLEDCHKDAEDCSADVADCLESLKDCNCIDPSAGLLFVYFQMFVYIVLSFQEFYYYYFFANNKKQFLKWKLQQLFVYIFTVGQKIIYKSPGQKHSWNQMNQFHGNFFWIFFWYFPFSRSKISIVIRKVFKENFVKLILKLISNSFILPPLDYFKFSGPLYSGQQ